MKCRLHPLVFSCAIGFISALAGAQTPAATFDVASVKPNKSGSTQTTIGHRSR